MNSTKPLFRISSDDNKITITDDECCIKIICHIDKKGIILSLLAQCGYNGDSIIIIDEIMKTERYGNYQGTMTKFLNLLKSRPVLVNIDYLEEHAWLEYGGTDGIAPSSMSIDKTLEYYGFSSIMTDLLINGFILFDNEASSQIVSQMRPSDTYEEQMHLDIEQ